jgi:hypothetical protein
MSFKFNPTTGNLDLVGDGSSTVVPSSVDVTLLAAEDISALKVVYADTPTSVRVASSNLDQKPIGVAMTAALSGQSVMIRCFGELADASFSFAANEPLFLNGIGNLSSVAAVSGYHVECAHGMGLGKVFVNVKNQITL